MHYHSDELIRDLSVKAQTFRIQVLKMVYHAQSGHLGGAFSAAEILAALYFHHLRIDPANPGWPERDRLLFSKGHACAVLYTALAYRGFFPVEELPDLPAVQQPPAGSPGPAQELPASKCAPVRSDMASRSALVWRWH